MTKPEPSIEKFEVVLTLKERELLIQRDDVWRFRDTEHKSKATKEFQKQVRKSSLEISSILVALIDFQEAGNFKDAAKSLCERCRDLETYTRDMNKILADDLDEREKEEEKKKIDLIKNVTFFFAIPFGFLTAVKNGLTHGQVDLDQAAEAGFAVSATVVFHKSLAQTFTSLGSTICRTPQQIRNSFTLYYARETFRQKTIAGISGFKDGAELIGREVTKTSGRVRKTLKRITGGNGPKI